MNFEANSKSVLISLLRSPSSNSTRPSPRKKEIERFVVNFGELGQFNYIHSALARLALRDIRLGAAEALSHFDLGQVSINSGTNESLKKPLVSLRMKAFS